MKKTILTALTLFFTSISISTYAEEFTDIDQTNFSYEILESLSKKYNFTFDYPDFKFNGSKTVNRYELAKMILKALECAEEKIEDESDRHILEQLANDFYVEIEVVKKKLNNLKEMEDQIDMLETNVEKQSSDINFLSKMLPFNINGDLGFRYQLTAKDLDKFFDNQVPQVRASLSLSSKDNSPIGYGLRLVSGGMNRTVTTWWKLSDFFGKVPLHFDKFFVKYKPNENFNFTLGRFSNPFGSSDIYFDDEITQQGALQSLKFSEVSPILKELSFTAGEVVVNMDSTFKNTFSMNALADAKLSFDDFILLNLKTGYYHYIGENNIAQANENAKTANQEAKLTGNANTNTLDDKKNFLYQFKIVDAFAKSVIKINDDFPLTLSASYLYNLGAAKDNQGLKLGAKIGTLREIGNFFFSYDFVSLQSDATISFFTESSLGGTDVNAHEFALGTKLFDSTVLSSSLTMKNSIKKQDPLTYVLRVNLIQSF
ncbi:MAG: putative porin [Candidatus Sericytochromatia bacterium]